MFLLSITGKYVYSHAEVFLIQALLQIDIGVVWPAGCYAGAENKSTLQLAAAARPPPPPPPPPKTEEASSSSAAPQLNEEPPHIEAPCSSSLEDEQPTQSPQQHEEAAAAPIVDTDVDAGAADGGTEDPSLPRPAQHHLTAEDVFGE
eukprot:s1734_g6.t1